MIKNEKAKNYILLFMIPIVVYVIFRIVNPERFGSFSSIYILLQQSFIPAVGACGFFFVMTIGMFDMSFGSNVVISAMVGTLLASQFGYIGFFVGSILTGMLVGTINGFVYTKLKIPSIIVTAGMMIIYECFTNYVTDGAVELSSAHRLFSLSPYNVILCFVAFTIAYCLLSYTRIGIYANAIGSNEVIARTMGINVPRYKALGFVVSGFFIGIMSILSMSTGGSMLPAINMSSLARNLTPVMGCFIGIALKKNIHPVISIVIGEFTISMIINGLMTNGIDVTLQNFIVGIVLLVIVGITSWSKRKEE